MEKTISEIRLEIITNEYLRQISKQKDKYSNYADFPYLNSIEYPQAFLNKKIEVRSNLRLLSISVLCGYISATLNQDYSDKIDSLIMLDYDLTEELKVNDPLIYILISLFQSKENLEEINSKYTYDFETFLYYERDYRSKNKFKDLLYLIDETRTEALTNFVKSANTSNVRSKFWESYTTNNFERKGFNNLSFYTSTIELLDFINSLSEFLISIENLIVRSAFWFYFKNFITAFEIVAGKMLLFSRGLLESNNYLENLKQTEMTTQEQNEVLKDRNEEISKTIKNVQWIVNNSNHNSIEQFVQSDNDYVYALAT